MVSAITISGRTTTSLECNMKICEGITKIILDEASPVTKNVHPI